MTAMENLTERRLREVERQLVERTGERDAARAMFAVVEEQGEAALRLHRLNIMNGLWCEECSRVWPCPTRRALTGADEDAVA